MPTRTLQVAAELSQLAAIRRFVVEAGAAWQVAPAVIDPLVLAVDELAANSIVHGYRGQPGTIEVEIERTAEALVVHLRDQAPPFDPTGLPEPDIKLPLEQRPVGGMGVYLARHSVDQMTHAVPPQGGNLLTLVKKDGDAKTRQSRTSTMIMKDEQAKAGVPVTILRLDGDLDGSNYRQLIERAKALHAGGAQRLLLDLTSVPYMSSAGLVALHSAALVFQNQPLPDAEYGWRSIRAVADAGEVGTQPYVKLLKPQPRVASVLEQTGLRQFFTVFEDEAAALASF